MSKTPALTIIKKQLEDVPGTYVFTKDRCRMGMQLNLFFAALLKPENREEFLADEARFLARFPLSNEQRRCVLERDWTGLLRLGANIYHMGKLSSTDRITFQNLASRMSGMSQQDYREMMLRGGRPIDGNRSKADPNWSR